MQWPPNNQKNAGCLRLPRQGTLAGSDRTKHLRRLLGVQDGAHSWRGPRTARSATPKGCVFGVRWSIDVPEEMDKEKNHRLRDLVFTT